MLIQIELPHPTEDARARIMQIHSRKMNVDLTGEKSGVKCPVVYCLSIELPRVRWYYVCVL